jgi:uncharacterized protein
MGERTEYAPGTFSWVDLGTTDVDGAKAFYSQLFGWQSEDMPVPDSSPYTMFRANGKYVAAVYEQQEEQRAQGVPPNWMSYITVDDLDRRADKAKDLGGTVMAGPFDVMEAGRMAVVQDPTGAVFGLWEPRQHIGAGLVNDPGAFGWNELSTRDVDAARSFYEGLFGWTTEESDAGPMPYTTIKNGDRMNGGMLAIAQDWGDVPPHWRVYFTVVNCDAGTARVEQLGGSRIFGPMDIPIGRFSVVTDPQGATFSLFQGDTDP